MDNKQDNLSEIGREDLLAIVGENTAISQWSDDKKKEFVRTFEDRVEAARYILDATAHIILMSAHRRKFVSHLHLGKIYKNGVPSSTESTKYTFDPNNARSKRCGGRTADELFEIAEQRAKLVLDELPVLKNAVKIIDPETAEKIDRREKLLAEGQQKLEQLELLNDHLSLEDVNQDMTVGELRKLIKERDQKRRKLTSRLQAIGSEGVALEDAINKRLYRGLPGLSEAIIDAARHQVDRAKVLGETSRRVTERVMFGDSNEALQLLKVFEHDEAAVPEAMKRSVREALEKLHLAKSRKGLKGGAQ